MRSQVRKTCCTSRNGVIVLKLIQLVGRTVYAVITVNRIRLVKRDFTVGVGKRNGFVACQRRGITGRCYFRLGNSVSAAVNFRDLIHSVVRNTGNDNAVIIVCRNRNRKGQLSCIRIVVVSLSYIFGISNLYAVVCSKGLTRICSKRNTARLCQSDLEVEVCIFCNLCSRIGTAVDNLFQRQ